MKAKLFSAGTLLLFGLLYSVFYNGQSSSSSATTTTTARNSDDATNNIRRRLMDDSTTAAAMGDHSLQDTVTTTTTTTANNDTPSFLLQEDNISRTLEEEDDDDCKDRDKIDPSWVIVFYFTGILYMFLAIAIVCDELFVPTLEEMASERHLNLSMDVAGATLMAAGGSAPELFTSIFGTFVHHSEVGIGTVVGSAVFNVLFVIAMCALLSHEVLELTWWPLFRDSTFYSLGLIVLGIFVGVVSPKDISLWEAIVLFLLYIGYVVVMAFNERLYKFLTGKELRSIHPSKAAVIENEQGDGIVRTMDNHLNEDDNHDDDDEEDQDKEEDQQAKETRTVDFDAPPTDEDNTSSDESPLPQPSSSSNTPITTTKGVERGVSIRSTSKSALTVGQPMWPGTFRSGILKILRGENLMDTSARWKAADAVGIGIVAVIAGDVHHVFRKVDVDGSGHLDREELAQLFAKLDCTVLPDELDRIMQDLDVDRDGKITEEDFTVWYIKSENRISEGVRQVFEYFDADKSGTINRDKIKQLLATLEPSVTDEDVEEAMKAMYQNGSVDEISFEEFSKWYTESMIYERQVHQMEESMNEDDEDNILDSLKPPIGEGCGAYIKYVLVFPIALVLGLTVPDVRREGNEKYCYWSFFLSIGWIGFFSYFMVEWAELIGHTIGIPSVIMGLTLLAAGTSVPDLLTSVIVARMGEGDMALSSSIGSNIFDILVGLPLPWIFYTAIHNTTIEIGSDNVWVYIFTLLGMLIFVVVSTHLQGWKLTRTLAFLMLLFYFGFLGLAVGLELPFEVC